jgi:hypothetical protein
MILDAILDKSGFLNAVHRNAAMPSCNLGYQFFGGKVFCVNKCGSSIGGFSERHIIVPYDKKKNGIPHSFCQSSLDKAFRARSEMVISSIGGL